MKHGSHYRSIAFSILLAIGTRALAEAAPGADWHLASATTVLLVHIPSAAELETLPPDLHNVWIVDNVLKGSDTRRYIPAFGAAQPPGTRGMVLLLFRGMPSSAIGAERKTPQSRTEDIFWPITTIGDESLVEAKVPISSRGWIMGSPPRPIPLSELQRVLPPEEILLHAQMLNALFFPNRLAELQRQDPSRAKFVQMNLAISDLARDVPALANLLESPDPALSSAAAAHLQKLTHASIPAPEGDDRVLLHNHVLAWRDWWNAHAAGLAWQESSFSYVPRAKDDDPVADRWPPVPASLELPPNPLTENLLKALTVEKGSP